jgi:pimeloyl-ACP methyl ester carboxylesterase
VTARLYRERVTAGGATPARWLAMTHGIYGSGGNWRSVARKIVDRRPEWGAVLVDLRGHGRSEQGAPPHTIAACAGDLRACLDELAQDGVRVDVIAGHSFGGKVALAVRAAAHAGELAQTWALDSTPSPRPGMWDRPDNDVRTVWEAMRDLPRTWSRRDDFVAAIVARGHAVQLAQWLAMSLQPVSAGEAGGGGAPAGGFRLGLDLDAVRAMLEDYYAVDLWPAVEDASLPGEVRLLIAERSGTVSADDRARLARLAAAPTSRVHADVIAGAGHWLHIDAPVAVVDRFVAALPHAPGR